MVRKQLYCLSICLLVSLCSFSQTKTQTINGIVYDGGTGESLIGALIYQKDTKAAATTNAYGFFSLDVTGDNPIIEVSYIGFDVYTSEIDINSNQTLNIYLSTSQTMIDEIVITADQHKAEEFVKSTTMGKMEIPIAVLEKLPVIFGESDVMKVIQLMPGVQKGGGVGLGLYVRGGGNDENLIMLDEATVYNPGHLLGFLSVFNTASLKSVDVYKGSFPAKYGGRLSSVIDIRMKEGNNQGAVLEGSIGNIASSLTYQMPIVKGKGSFIISARRSYLDRIVDAVGPNFFPYHFYDFNLKANYTLNDNDRVYFSSYLGRDVLDVATEGEEDDPLRLGFSFDQGNRTTTLRWNHLYSNKKLFHNLTFLSSSFSYDSNLDVFDNNLLVQSSINDLGLKLDFDYSIDNDFKIAFGAQALHHNFRPNLFSYKGDIVEQLVDTFDPDFQEISLSNTELGLYGLIDKEISEAIRVNLGLRFTGSITEDINYFRPEPRVAFRYALNDNHSLKASYSRMSQYLHLVSGSTVALPTDLWYPITEKIKPGVSDQWGLAYNTHFGKQNKQVLVTTEIYYKNLYELIEYKEGANLFFNNNFEDELISGSGESYGAEVLLQKDKGNLTGWLGYTLSWANRTFPEINLGESYPARYDRRHDFSIVANYRKKSDSRLAYSAVWVMSSGSPFTPIVGKYLQANPTTSGIDILPIYPDRNSYRLNGSNRLDFDLTIYSKKKRDKFRGEWHIGAYNVLNKVQPSRVTVTTDATGDIKYQERGYFGFLFSLGYKFKWAQLGIN